MNFEEITFASAKFKTSGGMITVRGLSLNEVMVLTENYLAPLKTIFDHISEEENATIDPKQAQVIGMSMLRQFPNFGAEIIALAADAHTEKGIAVAAKLTIPRQLEILAKIAEMTFEMEGDVKKSVSLIASLIQSSLMVLSELATQNGLLNLGSGESGSK